VKKFIGSFVAVLSMLAAMMLASTGTALATHPNDADCNQQLNLVVVCDVDFDLTILEDPDVVIEIDDVRALTDNEIEILENALKEGIDVDVSDIDVNVIKDVVVTVFEEEFDIDIDVDDVTVFLCILNTHPHCH
jgi:hypothetical protein